MLWDVIRDFFVQYVFGGYLSNGQSVAAPISRYGGVASTTTNTYVEMGLNNPTGVMKMPIGDWLSTTATIITLCLLFFAAVKFVIWLTKYFAGVISMRRG